MMYIISNYQAKGRTGWVRLVEVFNDGVQIYTWRIADDMGVIAKLMGRTDVIVSQNVIVVTATEFDRMQREYMERATL